MIKVFSTKITKKWWVRSVQLVIRFYQLFLKIKIHRKRNQDFKNKNIFKTYLQNLS